MASFEEHCEDCKKSLGEPFEEVHHWLDAFHDKKGSFAHRDNRHHLEGIEEVRKMWGDKAAEAAKIHIMLDWACIESEIPKNNADAMFFRTVKMKEREQRDVWVKLSQQQKDVVRETHKKDLFNH